ncbi:hypothetical protein CHU92_03445 [Flavobacterium cyanobacteriorum]|uniref:Addiction module protein n=1 Tax=Flavobacterium cyanobacteriorum TaxID=2022802 RepID=A0A255ZR52_9FLAO|nr:hypothetical protein [Flavobacterium cyanobacteriorum]OYQ43404.1 hypothetical protein CHU92_03445 [Flavobacterium cyanobacteriorum]
MDMQSRKYRVIEKLLQVNEEETLYRLEAILQSEKPEISWHELPEETKKVIDMSLGQSDLGKVKSHDEVVSDIRKKYNLA